MARLTKDKSLRKTRISSLFWENIEFQKSEMAIFSDFKVKFMQKTTTNLNGLWENISANFLGVDLMRLGENLIPVGRWMPPPPNIWF